MKYLAIILVIINAILLILITILFCMKRLKLENKWYFIPWASINFICSVILVSSYK